MEKIVPDVILVGLIVGVFVGGTVWALAWWLSGQFERTHTLIYQQIAKVEQTIFNKLEYHEKHDDQRFMEVRDGLSEIRIRNAAKDMSMGTLVEQMNKLSNPK